MRSERVLRYRRANMGIARRPCLEEHVLPRKSVSTSILARSVNLTTISSVSSPAMDEWSEEKEEEEEGGRGVPSVDPRVLRAGTGRVFCCPSSCSLRSMSFSWKRDETNDENFGSGGGETGRGRGLPWRGLGGRIAVVVCVRCGQPSGPATDGGRP